MEGPWLSHDGIENPLIPLEWSTEIPLSGQQRLAAVPDKPSTAVDEGDRYHSLVSLSGRPQGLNHDEECAGTDQWCQVVVISRPARRHGPRTIASGGSQERVPADQMNTLSRRALGMRHTCNRELDPA